MLWSPPCIGIEENGEEYEVLIVGVGRADWYPPLLGLSSEERLPEWLVEELPLLTEPYQLLWSLYEEYCDGASISRLPEFEYDIGLKAEDGDSSEGVIECIECDEWPYMPLP